MKLIENWRSWYKMFSVQMLAVIAFVQGVLFVLPGSALDARVPFVELSWRDLGVAPRAIANLRAPAGVQSTT